MKSIKSFPIYTQRGIAHKPIIQELEALSAMLWCYYQKYQSSAFQFEEIKRVTCMTERITNERNIMTNIVENIINQAI